MRAYIFANGVFEHPGHPPNLTAEDLVIAADGGSHHCRELGIIPDFLIGDLDSADPDLTALWEESGTKVIRYPTVKDQTDLELALMLAQEQGADEILVYGAAGGRLDMTFGNLTLLAHPGLHIPATLICGSEEVHLIKPGEKLILKGLPGETLSLIPLDPDTTIVSARGVGYPLEEEELIYGTTRGISNYLENSQAEITLTAGLLAVVHNRAFPSKES